MNKKFFLYQDHLDTLRALAVLFVFLFHINKEIFAFGYVGVDIFFVISGFVISQSLIQKKYISKEISFLEFYTKRILRLFPSLLTMVLFFFVMYLILVNYGDFELQLNFKSSLYSLLGISNFYFFSNIDQFDYFNIDNYSSPLIHTWSLGVEEQFYFIYPLLIVLIFFVINKIKNSLKFLFILLTILQLVSFYIFANSFNISHFYLPFARAWELLTGCLLFLCTNPYTKELIGKKIIFYSSIFFALFILYFVFLNNEFNEKYLIVLFIFLTIFYILFYKKFLKILYQSDLILYLGKASYSIYLWHMPIIFFCNLYFKSYIFYATSIFFTIIFSYGSYKFIEPLRYNKFLKEKINLILKLLPVTFIIIFFSIAFNNNFKYRNFLHNTIVSINKNLSFININKETQKNRLSRKWELSVDKCKNNYENFKRIEYLNCIKNEDSNELFFLMGDSYGEHFINVLAANDEINNLYFARLDNENFNNIENVDTTEYTKKSYKKIKEQFNGKKTIIISIKYPKKIDYKKLEDFLGSLDADNITLISPHLVKASDSKCKNAYSNFQICHLIKDEKNIENFKFNINLIKNSNPNVNIYDFTSFFCNSNICSNYLKKIDLYIFVDKFNHITKEFAEYISPNFQAFLKSIKNYN